MARARLRNRLQSRSAVSVAIAVALIGVVAFASLSWLKPGDFGVAVGSASPSLLGASHPPTAISQTASPVVTGSATSPYPTYGSGWPLSAPCATAQDQGICIFAPDGSMYLIAPGVGGQIYAYDPTGHLRPGWPIPAPEGSGYGADRGYAAAPDDSLLVWTLNGITDIEATGRVHPGWPVTLPEGDSKYTHGQILVQPSGRILFAQVDYATPDAWIYSLTVDGDAPVVWSSHLAGTFDAFPLPAASNGTVFVTGTTPPPAGQTTVASTVAALASDGKLIGTWSKDQGYPVAVTPDGNLVITSADTKAATTGNEIKILRSHVAVVDPTGKALPGWPRVVEGPSSGPAVGPDGSLYFVLGDGTATGSLLALDASGNVEPGWPVSLPAGYSGTTGPRSAGPYTTVSEPPIVANGLVCVAGVSANGDNQIVVAVEASGSEHQSWVYRPPAGARLSYPFTPSSTGTLYVPMGVQDSNLNWTGAVAALGTNGEMLPGWPWVSSVIPLAVTVLADGGLGVSSMDFATRLTPSGSTAR